MIIIVINSTSLNLASVVLGGKLSREVRTPGDNRTTNVNLMVGNCG